MKRKKGNPKLWSVTHIRDDRHPHILVRVTELRGTPFLYLGRQVEGKARYEVLKPRVTRVSLGSTPKEQEQKARALALNEIERIAREETAPTESRADGLLTLALLADRYERDGFAARSDAYKRDALAAIRRVAEFLGANTVLGDVKPSDVQKYVAHRLGQGVTAAARGDLVALSIGINWAVGEGLLEVNPLSAKRAREAMKIEHKPRRPVASPERYQKLQTVAPMLPPAFGVLLDLAWHTGHRIAAILGLRRGWATARKHLPIQDVAVGGGWLDTVTPATIYQQADAETTLAVATHVA